MGIGRIVQDIGHASGSWHLSLVPCAFRFAIVVALRWRGLLGNWGEEPTAAAGTTTSATATTNTLLRVLLASITKKGHEYCPVVAPALVVVLLFLAAPLSVNYSAEVYFLQATEKTRRVLG